MTEALSGLEGLLHEALSPIDPPEDLVLRLEGALTSLTESAVEELEAWELSAMRDPRNWVRPATAIVVGGGAGVALVLLRARHRPNPDASGLRGVRRAALRAVGDVGEHTRRLLG
ncbi:MAG TPA: hypothetical protein VNU24_02765 [Solirubrobacteraceae bacterium]|jgi:hypothetical protein|nr:hypothetical protein [Solirubrobacteraceae bacterium]